MRSVVTGAAGFIGSHVVEHLLALGHEVVGIDSFSPYYDPALKRANSAVLLAHARFHLLEGSLQHLDLQGALVGVDYIFHLAAQPGVRASWGDRFAEYVSTNILATQLLLDSLKGSSLKKFVYASSSSVYGNAPLPLRESSAPHPLSPYAVSKLAAEQLCDLYHRSHGIPTVNLRYFTVYGPRQRPDMAIRAFIQAIAAGQSLTIHGDGDQSRDFIYVEDVARATVLAALSPHAGITCNIASGLPVTLKRLVDVLQDILGRRAELVHAEEQNGDVTHTAAECSRARDLLGFVSAMAFADGLHRQVVWQLGALERPS